MMKKIVSLFSLALLTVSAWAQTPVTLDFTSNDEWGFPTEYTVDEATFTAGGYTITIAGSEGNGYKFNSTSQGDYLIFGKSGAYLTLPAFSNDVKKIVVVGRNGASTSVKQNIYVDGEAISTETTGCVDANTYAIPAEYQAAGTIYTLMVNSDHNSQVTSIVVYFEDDVDPVDPGTSNTYTKVTSLDQLEVGKKYILVNEENSRAMGALSNTSTSYGTAVNITLANGAINIAGTDVVELTLGEGSPDEFNHPTWTFDMGGEGHFICWTSGNSLNSVNNAAPNNAMWFATITDNGVELTNKSDNTRKLQYNSGSPRFACYASNQKPAVLYVQAAPAEEEGITKLSEANALEDGENFTFNGNAVVTVYKNGYLFLRDESGFGQIRNVNGGSFVNGQVLNPGWEATKAGENNWNWFVNASGLSASGETNTELAAPIVLDGAVDDSMLNAYVCIENQVPSFFPARSFLLPDGTRISKTENYWAGNADATTGNYNVYGVIVKVGDAYCINITEYANYVPPFKRGDVNKDGVVNIADVTALIDYLLSGDPTPVNLNACDCNQDTAVNIADVTSLIDYLLSNEWPN